MRHSPLRKRWKFLISLVILAVVATFVASSGRQEEPHYHGKPLSTWLTISYIPNDESMEAVRQIGTNSIPFLIKWMCYERPE